MSLRKDRTTVLLRAMKIRRTHAIFAAGTCFIGLAAYGVGCSVPERTFYDDSAGSGGSSAGSAGSAGSAKAGAPSSAGANDGGTMGEAGQAGQAQGGEAGTTETAGRAMCAPRRAKG